MISKKHARDVWPRDTQVIRRGDAGWTSDRPDRQGESYGHNPTSRMDQKLRVAEKHVALSTDGLPDPSQLPVDARAKTVVGPDIYEFRISELKSGAHVWRQWAIHRNAAR